MDNTILQDEGQITQNPQPTQEVQQPEPKKKSKIEILADIKKMFEKNGFSIQDDVLLSLLDSVQVQGLTLSRRYELYELQQVQDNADVQKILVFPRGKHWIEQYNEWLEYDDNFFNEIAKNFNDKSLNKPYIDVDHDYKESRGEIINYEINKDGMFWYIKLNDIGRELVKKGLYKYVSPSFGDVTDTKKKSHKNWMVTISLTNNPAFLGVIPELQEQIQLAREKETRKKQEKTGAIKMNELVLKKLGKFVELQGEVSPEAIFQALPEILKMLEELTAKVQELTGMNEQQEEVIQEQNAQLTKINNEILEAEAEKVAEEAVKLGKWNCNEKFIELKKQQYIKDKEAILTELSLIPEKKQHNEQQSVIDHSDIQALSNTLTDEEKKIANDSGFDISTPEKIKEFKMVIGG